MNTKEIAYRYIQACQVQECYEHKVSKAFELLCPDNQLMGLSDPISKPYRELVQELIGETTFDWIQWWQYDCDYGKDSREFVINGQEYSTDDMTVLKFLDIIVEPDPWTTN
jgi:hypothetical protein